MNRLSLPKRTPPWLLRQPHLLARWLAANNTLRRFARDRRRAVISIGVAVLAGLALLYATVATARAGAVDLIEPLLSYWPLIMLGASLHAAMTVARRLRRIVAAESKSWLAAAPIQPASARFAALVLSILPVILQWFAISAAIAIIAGAASASPRSVLLLIAALGVGMVCGLLVGLWAPQPKIRKAYQGSRYVRAAPRTGIQSLRVSNSALSRWPVNLTLAWSRPENARVLLLAALFAVQGGASILSGLTVVAMWGVAAYLTGLLAAVVRVSREASEWLRSTPIKFHAFAWPIARRALLHQVLGTAGAVAVMIALGATTAMALYCGVLWLALVMLIFTISLVESYRAASPALKIALSVTGMAAIELREHAWSIPLAAFITVWQLRVGLKS